MNFNIIFLLFSLLLFIGCKQLEEPQKKIIKKKPDIIKEKVTSKPSDEFEKDSSKTGNSNSKKEFRRIHMPVVNSLSKWPRHRFLSFPSLRFVTFSLDVCSSLFCI